MLVESRDFAVLRPVRDVTSAAGNLSTNIPSLTGRVDNP